MIRRVMLSFLAIAVLSLATLGCGPSFNAKAAVKAANDNNLKLIVTCYATFQAMNTSGGYMGPKDEAEFREFLNGKAATNFLTNVDFDTSNMDSLFVSDRDNAPFKIRWGVQGSPRGSNEPIVFETVGVDGKRLVGFTSHKYLEPASDKQYDEWFEGNYTPSEDEAERPAQVANPPGGGSP